MSGTSAYAICAPAAANDITATCSGTTINQNGTNGYGTGVETNLSTTVVQSATVTGSINGINFLTGTLNNSGTIQGNGGPSTGGVVFRGVGALINSGAITGNRNGVIAGGGSTITNSGSVTGTTLHGVTGAGELSVTNTGVIRGASTGINATAALNVTNSGTVTGVAFDGIANGLGDITVTNSGTVSGGRVGVLAFRDAIVRNSGTIAAVEDGIQADKIDLVNSGRISGGTGFSAVSSFATATVVNSGTLSGAKNGILASRAATVTNSGTISGTEFGIGSITTAMVDNTGTITSKVAISANNGVSVTNSGTVAGGQLGVTAALGAATVVNSGSITALFSAVRARTSAVVTNTGAIISTGDGGVAGVFSENTASVVNSGLISGETGVLAYDTATITNSGTIRGQINAIGTGLAVNVTNSGTIAANDYDAIASRAVTVSNSGTITAGSRSGSAGVFATGRANVSNSGTITGGFGVLAGASGEVSNSGTIIGTGGNAIQFRYNNGLAYQTNILTVLPGARFGGRIVFGGGADRVNFGAGSWIINTNNFNAARSTVTTPGNPYFVTPNQIVVADVSGFGAQNRAITAITGWIASVLPDTPVFAPAAAVSGANSFASVDTAASPFDAFASASPEALGYAATKAPVFKAGAVSYADGSAVWAKAFGGQRQQDSTAAAFGSTTSGYGGAVGYERMLKPDLKIGALIGGSANKTDLHQNAGSTSTDTVFGGVYGRGTRGGSFLDLSVIGGNLDNRNARNIGGGLAVQTASASYDGWFVTPAMMAGHRFDIDGRGFTITPAIKARYLAARFGGYTETGSAANLSIGGRDFQAFEERAEVTLANTRTIWNGHLVTARVTGGFLAQQRTTGNQVNVVLLGQNFVATTPDRGSVAGGYAAAGIDWQMERVTLFAAGEGTYTDDVARSYSGKGGIRVTW